VSQFERWDHSWGYPTTDVFIEKSLHSWITIGVKLTGLLYLPCSAPDPPVCE
jgi:hypothetical protein